jgi:hypothetical protein
LRLLRQGRFASEQAMSELAASPTRSGDDDPIKKRWEIIFGMTLTLFAASLAVNELASGKYGDDELQLNGLRTSAYLWYQSKGIKETLVEGQRDLLKMLGEAGVVASAQQPVVQHQVEELGRRIERYGKEKSEILLGSSVVGKDNWVQDVEGQLGKVDGVKQIEARLDRYGAAGDRFDLATLFLQLCMVLGAIGIIVSQVKLKRLFLGGMLLLGVLGAGCSILALRMVGFF